PTDYLYDALDPGASVQLDYDKLSEINNTETATHIVKEAVQELTADQKKAATGIDKITLFAEEAVSRASTINQADQGEVVINDQLIKEAAASAKNTKQAVEQVLKQQGIEQQRNLRTTVSLNVNNLTKLTTIKLDSSIEKTEADLIQITSGS